jgi:hypothetical protein
MIFLNFCDFKYGVSCLEADFFVGDQQFREENNLLICFVMTRIFEEACGHLVIYESKGYVITYLRQYTVLNNFTKYLKNLSGCNSCI